MDDHRVGRSLRVLRRRRGLRQVDVAARAGISQPLVSAIESGRMATVTIGTLRRVFRAVDAGFEGLVDWRGASLDRLLDARHAAIVAAAVERHTSLGWQTVVEATYSIYGERGSIDVLAGRQERLAVAVVEVKSDLVQLESTLRKLDEKERLVRERIARDRFGWQPVVVGRLLILPDTDAARRRVAQLGSVLAVAFPNRGTRVRRWLRDPVGELSGILFLSNIRPNDGNVAVQRGNGAVQRGNGPAATKMAPARRLERATRRSETR